MPCHQAVVKVYVLTWCQELPSQPTCRSCQLHWKRLLHLKLLKAATPQQDRTQDKCKQDLDKLPHCTQSAAEDIKRNASF